MAADPRFTINYAAGGTAAARIASLAASPRGPLRAAPQHVLCQLVGDFDPAVPSHEIGMSEIEYCVMDALKFDAALDGEHPGWHAPPTRLSALFRDMVAKGMPTHCVGSWDAARVVCLEWISKLTDAQRTYQHADMIIEAAPAGWVALITAAKARKTDTDNSICTQFRTLVPAIYTVASRTQTHYTDLAQMHSKKGRNALN